MTSKYAIALYELVQLRANLQKSAETFPIDRFRELMGVPPGKLLRGNHFVERVLDIAEIEVNGLSDYGVEIETVRESPRAPITALTIAWWRKEGDEYRDTMRELQRPKVGRMARLRGTIEQVMPPLVQIADATPAVSGEPTTPAASDQERNRQQLLDFVRRREEAGKNVFVDDD
jgi:Initiator Rep protein, WH2